MGGALGHRFLMIFHRLFFGTFLKHFWDIFQYFLKISDRASTA